MCILSLRQGWIFLIIRGYSIREKFPFFAGSGKSFLILHYARFLCPEHFFFRKEISMPGKHFSGKEHFQEKEHCLPGRDFSDKETFPRKRNFPIDLPSRYISVQDTFPRQRFAWQWQFFWEDIFLPRTFFFGRRFPYPGNPSQQENFPAQRFIYFVYCRKIWPIYAPFSGKSLLLWKLPSRKSFQILGKYAPLA